MQLFVALEFGDVDGDEEMSARIATGIGTATRNGDSKRLASTLSSRPRRTGMWNGECGTDARSKTGLREK